MQCLNSVSSAGGLRPTVVITLAMLAGGCQRVWVDLTDDSDKTQRATEQGSGGSGGAGAGAGEQSGGSEGGSPGGTGGSGGSAPAQCTTLSEHEPNDEQGLNAQPVLQCGTLINGTFDPKKLHDADKYILSVAEDNTMLTIETFDRNGNCRDLATQLKLTKPPSTTPELRDDTSHDGIKNCSAIAGVLQQGLYYVSVKQEETTKTTENDYMIQVRCYQAEVVKASKGSTQLENKNRDFFISSSLEKETMNEFTIDLKQGQSLHAGLVFDDSKCGDFDGELDLQYPSQKESEVTQSGSGGKCAFVGDNGSSKGPGLYTLKVVNNDTSSFNYLLFITVRQDAWCSAEQ